MELPDYAELRRRAGIERAAEMRRLMTLLRRFVRHAVRFFGTHGHRTTGQSLYGLRAIPVRSRRWPAPYDVSHRDIF